MIKVIHYLNIILILLITLLFTYKYIKVCKEVRRLKYQNEMLESLIEDFYKCDDVYIYKGDEKTISI